MSGQQKREIAQAINDMRREVGLQPYDTASLEEMNTEELERLYRRQVALKETYKKKKPKSRFNLKIGLLIVILIILAFILIQLTFKPFGQLGEKLSSFFIPSMREEKQQVKFVVSFGYIMNNSPVFILYNQGPNIASLDIRVDGTKKSYEIVSGSLPLETDKSLYFRLESLCDNKTHLIQVIVKSMEANTTLTNECGIKQYHLQ